MRWLVSGRADGIRALDRYERLDMRYERVEPVLPGPLAQVDQHGSGTTSLTGNLAGATLGICQQK